jgi:nucleotide-binding universal stress UspA family protein
MKTILVPLDGSTRAEVALGPALALREATKARVCLMTTRWDTGTVEPERYLREMTSRYPDVDTELIIDRPPAEAILLVLDEGPDAVACMATHGRGGLGQAVLGSVAEEVIRGTDRPIVLVGPSYRPPPPSAGPLRIVAAWDGSEVSTAVAPAVVELASQLEAAVTVVEVVPTPSLAPVRRDPETGEERPTLEALVRAAGVPVEHSVRRGDPAEEIAIAADVLDAGYVVMATHGRSGLARLALGSVAMRVVHHSRCPVVVVRPAAVR